MATIPRGFGLSIAVGLVWAHGALAQPITVGVAAPMTGLGAAFGAQVQQGVEQAVADIDAQGGLLGRPLTVTVQDDACSPRQAVAAAHILSKANAAVVIGDVCSAASIAAAQVYTEESILQITPASTDPALTELGGWNRFRLCGRDDEQGKLAADYIVTHAQGAKVAVLDDNGAYGRDLASDVVHALHAKGQDPALVTHYVPGAADYAALLGQLKAAGVTIAYLGGYARDIGTIAQQARQRGLHLQIIGGDALMTPDFAHLAGNAAEGTIMTFLTDPRDLPDATAAKLAFDAAHIVPGGYTLYSYAAVQIWAEAVKKAKTLDPHKVASKLKAAGPWASAVGPVQFNARGDARNRPYQVYRFQKGQWLKV